MVCAYKNGAATTACAVNKHATKTPTSSEIYVIRPSDWSRKTTAWIDVRIQLTFAHTIEEVTALSRQPLTLENHDLELTFRTDDVVMDTIQTLADRRVWTALVWRRGVTDRYGVEWAIRDDENIR